jgi:hypothetical protein
MKTFEVTKYLDQQTTSESQPTPEIIKKAEVTY